MKRPCLIVFAVLAATVWWCSIRAQEIALVATLKQVEGSVKVKSVGQDAFKEVSPGFALKEGDAIHVGPAPSRAVIAFGSEQQLILQPFTDFKITGMNADFRRGSRKNDVEIWSGKAYVKVQKLKSSDSTFTVRTPTATAAVRGTKFSAEVGADEGSSFECLEGGILVSAQGKETYVAKNQKVSVPKGEPPSAPVPLEEADEKEWKDECPECLPPQLEVVEPAGSSTTVRETVAVRGRTDAGAAVTINGTAAAVDESGNFEASVSLKEGANAIVVEASNDVSEEKTRVSVQVVRESLSKKVHVCHIPPGNPGQQKTIEVFPAALQSHLNHGDCEGPCPCGEPDKTPPVLTVTQPASNLVVRTASIEVAGVTEPDARVTLNGTEVSVNADGSFSLPHSLEEGVNTLNFRAVDPAGNETTAARLVTLDTIAPTLTVIQPSAVFDVGCQTDPEAPIEVDVIGLTESNPTPTLTVQNRQVEVNDDGSFAQRTSLAPEEMEITLAATDAAGNRTTVVLKRVNVVDCPSEMTLSVAPTQFEQDGASVVMLSAEVRNFFGEPVDGVDVCFSVAPQGVCELTAVCSTTAGGVAATECIAGIGDGVYAVTFTATAKVASAKASATAVPSAPPEFP